MTSYTTVPANYVSQQEATLTSSTTYVQQPQGVDYSTAEGSSPTNTSSVWYQTSPTYLAGAPPTSWMTYLSSHGVDVDSLTMVSMQNGSITYKWAPPNN